MALHWVKIIEAGHMSTQRLFELGLSFRACKHKGHWPSLATMNSFLRQGRDDGELATDIEWDPCELTQKDYEDAVTAFMKGDPFTIDLGHETWEEWFSRVCRENTA